MNLDFSTEQKKLIARLEALLSRFPILGLVDRLEASKVYNAALMRSLAEEGLCDFGRQGASGLLNAMLVTHEVSKASGQIPIGLHTLLAPILFEERPVELLAIKRAETKTPVRFAAHAGILVVVGRDTARAYRQTADMVEPVKTNYGYPCGAYPSDPAQAPFGEWPAGSVTRRWQLALTGEVVGAMSGALDYLVSYLKKRRQFGREIGAFQAVQHRLAELAVSLEALRYLSLHAAWTDTDEAAACAACYAASAAHTMCLEAHQLSGAQGFTIDAGLYVWTLRLQSLSVEAGGAAWHASIAASAIWDVTSGPERSSHREGRLQNAALI